MFKLTTKERYGTRLVIDLALLGKGQPISLKVIAKRQNISVGYLEQVASLLKKAKLIKAKKGVIGGYLLAKAAEKITLRQILEALNGSIFSPRCLYMPSSCHRSKKCISKKTWEKLSKNILQNIEEITLENMICKKKGAKNG